MQRVAGAVFRGSDCGALECLDSVVELEVLPSGNCTRAVQGLSFFAEEGVSYKIQLFGVSEFEEDQETWGISLALSEAS